jgi:putative ABC transport system permease protein
MRILRNILEPFTSAWSGVSTRKLRSFLTILGVVIGVAAVIALMSIGRGVQNQIVGDIERLGSNLLFVRSGQVTTAGVRQAAGSATTLTLEDAQAIKQQVANIAAVAPQVTSYVQIVVGGQNTQTQVIGTTVEYPKVNNLLMAEGAFFTQGQFDAGMRVAVIGPTTKENVFGAEDPIGQQMRAGNNIVQVIGVFQSKGQTAMGTSDDMIIMPMTAVRQMSGQARTNTGEYVVQTMTVAMVDSDESTATKAEITQVLRDRHRLATGAADDFQITSVQEVADTISAAMGSMTLLLGSIAAISLLVGGIGVMNIMLVSVVERTREIGIRKALGARDWDVWTQFLLEASFLTLGGGIVGIGVGWGASMLVSAYGGLPTAVSADIVVLAVSVSVAIGLFFGFYPAWHASRLSPIQALRTVE